MSKGSFRRTTHALYDLKIRGVWGDSRNPETAQAIITRRIDDMTLPPSHGDDLGRRCALCDEPVRVSERTLQAFSGRELPPLWCAQCALDTVRQALP